MTDQLSDNEQLVENLAKAAYEAACGGVQTAPTFMLAQATYRTEFLNAVRAQLVAAGVVKLVVREKTTGERIAASLNAMTGGTHISYLEFLKDKINDAIWKTREECAKVADDGAIRCKPFTTTGAGEIERVAAAIRALK